jgi:hypothetical protein
MWYKLQLKAEPKASEFFTKRRATVKQRQGFFPIRNSVCRGFSTIVFFRVTYKKTTFNFISEARSLDPQEVVFHNPQCYKEIGIYCVQSIWKIVMFYSFSINNTFSSMFRTQCTPDFVVAEYYG